MSAESLTPKQQRIALRTAQKKKKNAKNVLLPPIEKSWSKIRANEAEIFKEKLREVFQQLDIERKKLQFNRGKDKLENKKEAKRVRDEQLTEEQKETRSKIILGVNAVTRSLEKKELRVVLADANSRPSTLTNHLLWLSESSSCRCVAVPDLLETVGDILNVTSLVALGIKREEETAEDKFSDILKLLDKHSIEEESRGQNLEEKETSEEMERAEEVNFEGDKNEEEQEEEEGEGVEEDAPKKSEDYDFRELYVYKKDLSLTLDTEPERAKKAKTEHFMGFSEEKHDDEMGVKRRKFLFHKAKIARIEGNPDRDSCKLTKKAKQSKGEAT